MFNLKTIVFNGGFSILWLVKNVELNRGVRLQPVGQALLSKNVELKVRLYLLVSNL